MKKTIVLSMAMAFATFGVFAQEESGASAPKGKTEQGTVEDRAKKQADKISGMAQLSVDQYAKVLAIAKDFITKKDAVRAAGGDDIKAKLKALNEQGEAQVKTVLTPAQLEKFEAARKEQRENREGHKEE